MFFVYENRFLARQIGPVMTFIPDNISVHVHLLEDNDPIKKKQRLLLSARWFSTKKQECFSEDHYWFISVDFVGRERSKLFQVVVLILEAAITFFSVQTATTTVCITRKMHLYRHLSRFLGRSLDFSSVWEGSWIWTCGWGNIVWGGGGGGVNEFQVIIGVHRLSSCTIGSILGNPGVTHSVTLHSSVMKGVKRNASPLGKRGCTGRDIERNDKVCQKFIGFISK